MKRIASFEINHDVLVPGLYTSRVDGDVVTYDLRFVRPNTPPFLPTATMHTIEHLFATYVRNSRHADRVIYFGPMGCRTGFYFLVRELDPADVVALTKETLAFIADYEGEIPGNTAAECGN
ncbi:MAG: S-ribosylhomocysteine lyase [Clostridia bacterium]|nr:S-ribosylhomocysteine lyase [Clostridia bacterium]